MTHEDTIHLEREAGGWVARWRDVEGRGPGIFAAARDLVEKIQARVKASGKPARIVTHVKKSGEFRPARGS